MIYVYGCPKNKQHPRKEVSHGMKEDPVILCDKCQARMHRVPQSIKFYMSPYQVLTDWMDENYRRHRARKAGKRVPRFSPDEVNSPSPIGNRDFEHRRVSNANKTKHRTT